MSVQTKGTSLADAIFEDLRKKILSDHWKAGDKLPPERDLAIEYETNRNTLREAIRKLEQSRLINVRHGSGVRVEDYRKRARIDLLGPFLEYASNNNERLEMLKDLLITRASVLEMMMRVATERAETVDLDRLRALTDQQQALFEDGNQAKLARGDLRWHQAIVDATHSLTTRWTANTFLEVYRGFILRFPDLWILHPEYPGFLADILEALEKKDPEQAVKVTRDYYRIIDAKMLGTLEILLSAFEGSES